MASRLLSFLLILLPWVALAAQPANVLFEGHIVQAIDGQTLAQAEKGPKLKGGYMGCLTEVAFDQVTQAVVNKDERGIRFLVDKGVCLVPKAGLPVSVLQRKWLGKVQVRVYVGNDALVLWTASENIVE